MKPYYRLLCKRPGFHDEYLATFNRQNVTLVDTRGAGVERITSGGVVVDGMEHQVDVIVLATGFDAGRGILSSAGIDIVGRAGRAMTAAWADGMRTFHGLQSHGFPNCFLLGLTQTSGSINYVHNVEVQAAHIAYVVGETLRRGAVTVEATAEAEAAWVEQVRSIVPPAVREFLQSCTPGYYNNEGDIDDPNRFGGQNALIGPVAFFDLLRAWREAGDLAGLELR